MAGGIRGGDKLLNLLEEIQESYSIKNVKKLDGLLDDLQKANSQYDKMEKRRKSLAGFDPTGKEYTKLVDNIEKNNKLKNKLASEIGSIMTTRQSHEILKKQIQYAKKNFPCAPISIASIHELEKRRQENLNSSPSVAGVMGDILNNLDYTPDEVRNILNKLPGNKNRNFSLKSLQNTFLPISKKCPKKYVSRDQKRFNEEKAINDMAETIIEILSID